MSEVAYIGLGSNLEDPKQQVIDAFDALKNIPCSQLVHQSSLYKSPPMGPQNQNDFINAVAKISTDLSPIELLDQLQAIESLQGRVRKSEQWGPRTLDLDLLLFGNQVINSERLTVPHYGMKERAFVLIPMAEISSDILTPDGSNINTLVEELTEQGIQRL